MKFVNLTPHAIHIIRADGTTDTVAPSGLVPRVAQTEVPVGSVDGIDVVSLVFGAPDVLPEREPDTYYIVSAMLASALREHNPSADLSHCLVPTRMVRDSAGRIIGCSAFSTPA
jgi:hypothetical protein